MMRTLLHAQLLAPFVAFQVLLFLDPSPPWDLFLALAYDLFCCYLIIDLKFDSGIEPHYYGCYLAVCALNGSYFLLLAKPLRNFKYIGNGNGNVDKVGWKRYFDIMCIHLSPRGIGWNYQVKNIPPAPRQSRREFILRSALRAAQFMVLSAVGRLYIWYNPAFDSTTIGTQDYVVQCINIFVFVGLTYWSVNAIYFAMAAGSVAIGLHEPGMWPDLFGAWRDAYTVRRFWGRTWHQLLRSFLVPYGKATSSVLGFRPGTPGSSYTQLYVAFFLSGLLHTGGDIVLFCNNPTTSQPFFSMPFFLLQAFIITLEDIMIGIATRLGVKSNAWTRVLGYLWVTTWVAWSYSVFVGDIIRAGGGLCESLRCRKSYDVL